MNTALPIAAYKNKIISTIKDNDVTIITAETGAGKSTQVPQYLLNEGYNLVVTQPRRLAARTVSARVAEEYGCKLGEIVGYRTAYERSDSKDTRCLFVTDGLAMVRELMGARKNSVLVIDEVHEWNLNIEVLVAWVQNQLAGDSDLKVVLMSATLEADRLSEYFSGAPVISVPGRLYHVEELPAISELEVEVADLVRQGRNVLVFQPGKKEIGDTIEILQGLYLNAEILPLHGELSNEEQARCFQPYSRPKCVVSTNVAQTSVTIDDIDAVVDSGMERRVELEDGVEGLYLKPISQSDSQQRKGRAGRTKPGVYIDHCPKRWETRPEFPIAEILRTRLDQTVLRLAEAGIDMEELTFFHQPDLAEIHAAKQTLRLLGCFDKTGKVTDIGRLVAKLPISVQYARMIVEADRLGVVDDVITIAAILEQGGVTARTCAQCKKYERRSCECWRLLAPGEETSDVLAQLAAYTAAEGMDRPTMMDRGIFAKAFFQARQQRKHLANALRGKVTFGSNGKRESILRAVCAGMVEHVYVNESGFYVNGDDIPRQLAKESVIRTCRFVVGQPWDLQITTRYGSEVLRLVRMATKINLLMLADVAAHLFEVREGLLPRYDTEKEAVVCTTEIYFNGQLLETRHEPVTDHPDFEQLKAHEANRSSIMDAASVAAAQVHDLYVRHSWNSLLPSSLLLELTEYLRQPNGNDLSFLEEWTVNAQAVVARVEATLTAKADAEQRQMDELLPEALELRNRINDMLHEHETRFSLDLFDRLDALDIDDDMMPRTVRLLQIWIEGAQVAITDAERVLATPQKESTLDISGLTAHFRR